MTLLIAGGGLAATVLLAPLFPLRQTPVDLTPGGHWPSVDGLIPVSETEAGPVLITVEYRIDPASRDQFLRLIYRNKATRLRDGAYAWGIYQDTEDPSLFVEEFRVASWSEHLRQHERATKYDQEREALARSFHIGPERPRVRHYLHAERPRPSGPTTG
jgi:Transmembrane secretion effector